MNNIKPDPNLFPNYVSVNFDFVIGHSQGECIDMMFMSGMDDKYRIVIREMNGEEIPLPPWERPEYDPYRVNVATHRGLNNKELEDDIIFRIDGLY